MQPSTFILDRVCLCIYYTAMNTDNNNIIHPGKNPAAVALGKLGGKKGGDARAKKLTPERRKEIARNASMTRWQNQNATKENGNTDLTVALDNYIKYGRQKKRELMKDALRKTIISKDINKIASYCYTRAISKETMRHMEELLIYGYSNYTITEEKALEIMKRVFWWAARLERLGQISFL